jgi:retinol-binding protein 3
MSLSSSPSLRASRLAAGLSARRPSPRLARRLAGLALLGGVVCARPLHAGTPAAPAAPAAPAPAAAPAKLSPPSPPSPPQPPQEDGPITAADRTAVITSLIAELDRHYVFPEKAAALGKKLRERQRRGAYARIVRGQALAQALTADMAALVHDKHLEVRYFEQPVPPTGPAGRPSAMDEEEAAEMRYLNHGVFEVRRMRFNLGYVTFNAFGRPVAIAAEKIAAAMRLLADTQGLIIDLRECQGGDTDTVTLAESYFFPASTPLLDLYERATNTTEHARAAADLAGPRYAADKPVVVLIGEGTVSGCEGFAYALQTHKRATVIGGRSAGAAYFGGPVRLADHFMAFVPVGRPIDPITHGDWEGTGVIPEIEAAADRAPAVAERTLLQRLAPQERSGRRKASMQKRIDELR